MGDKSGIEWTDATWNPIVGCSLVSPGCTNCYAMKMAARIENIDAKQRIRDYVAHRHLDEMHPTGRDPSRSAMLEARTHYAGTTTWSRAGAVWTGKVALAPDTILLAPLRWRRPRRIFVNSMGDLFHKSVPDDWIHKVFAVMALAPQHTFQVLTKRSARMRAYLTARHTPRDVYELVCDLTIEGRLQVALIAPGADERLAPPAPRIFLDRWPLTNVWLGVSAEDQPRANERIPDLLATPAAVRFVSAEPLLGPIDLHEFLLGFSAGHPASCACGHGHGFTRCPNYGRVSPSCHRCGCTEFRKAPGADGLHWIIAGGESGPHARPMHPDWARGLRDQCAAAGVPFFFKQWGEWSPVKILDEDEDGRLGPAYPMEGCTVAAAHKGKQECVFWQGDDLVHWPRVETVPAIGARRVGKRAAGRLLDGREHNEMPTAIA